MTEHVVPDVAVVRRLIAMQFPQYADRAVTVVESGATDNAVFRLGRDLVVRWPRNPDAALRLAKELRWLPQIARHVSVEVPAIVGAGRPGAGFPFPWAVLRWIDGRDATSTTPGDWFPAAAALGRMVGELRGMDAAAGPTPGAANSFRGAPLADLDERVRWGAAFWTAAGPGAEFTAGVDVGRLVRLWQDALDAPPWTGAPRWVHGDLLPGNVLLAGDELAAVIDFGCAGVGDPACDILPAWTLFTGRAREEYVRATFLDDATYVRARGWAVYVGVTAMPYHHLTNPAFCRFARGVVDELLAAD